MQTIQFDSQGYVFTVSGELQVKTCPVCGIIYALPVELDDWNQKSPSRGWCCPNKHDLHYPGKSDAQKVKDAKDALARERARHDQTKMSLSAQRGQATKARNQRDALAKRVAHGVCPCCHRSFKQLRRHMTNKHPDYVEAES